MRSVSAICLVPLLALSAGCTDAPSRPSDEAVRATLPRVLLRNCSPDAPLTRMIDVRGDYRLFYSGPAGEGADRYVVTLEGSDCVVEVLQERLVYDDGVTVTEPYFLRREDFPGHEGPSPTVPEWPLGYLASSELENAVLERRLDECLGEAGQGQSRQACLQQARQYFVARTAYLNIRPDDLPADGGIGVDLVEGVIHYRGQPIP